MSVVIGCPECGHLMVEGGDCETCRIRVAHPNPKCRFRVSATCPVPVECDHGYDVCPECDPCTCATATRPDRSRIFLVDVPRREYGPRCRQRWIIDDFRLGQFRSRKAAVRAGRAAGLAVR